MGRGSGAHEQQAISRTEVLRELGRSAAPPAGAPPAWTTGDQTADPRWHAAKQARRLLAVPTPGTASSIDASVLAGIVSDARAADPALAADVDKRTAWQALLDRTDRYDVTVERAPGRRAIFTGGREALVLLPGDEVFVIAPELAGDRPLRAAARHLPLSRVTDTPIELGDPAA